MTTEELRKMVNFSDLDLDAAGVGLPRCGDSDGECVEVGKRTRILKRINDMFLFDHCLSCVIPLRTGCLILAYVFLGSNFAIGISSINTITRLVNTMHLLSEEDHHVGMTAIVLNAVTLVLAVIAIPFNILLLVGLHKERRRYLKVFIMFQLAYLMIGVLLNIVVSCLGPSSIVGIVLTLVSFVLNIYYILVMRSQYVKMGEAANSLPELDSCTNITDITELSTYV
ncbi:uncharacterized protein [Maniola hyperantus]|uniref:uncharacterized protein n=1 Tax=Aphantopus hyperantus TaxID=2795564 RepID=UPI00213714CC